LSVMRELLEGSIQHRAQFVIARNPAICNGQVPRWSRITQRIIDLDRSRHPTANLRAIRYPHVLAAINVHPIPIGVDLQVIDRQVIHPRQKQAKVPALQHGKVAQQHVAAVLQRNRLVAHSRLLGSNSWVVAAGSALRAKDSGPCPRSGPSRDAEVVNVFAQMSELCQWLCHNPGRRPGCLRLGRVVRAAL